MRSLPLGVVVASLALGAPPWAETPVREVQGLPSLAPLVESVKSAVVNVEVASKVAQSPEEDQFYEFFFGRRQGQPAPQRQPIRRGAGSGFIIDSKGLVVTNNHVVEGAVSIRVKMDDG